MKIFALVVVIFALFASVMGLKDPVCGLEPRADGNGLIRCAAFIPSWSYMADTNACVDFVYGGCGGNLNRFESKAECEKLCKE